MLESMIPCLLMASPTAVLGSRYGFL